MAVKFLFLYVLVLFAALGGHLKVVIAGNTAPISETVATQEGESELHISHPHTYNPHYHHQDMAGAAQKVLRTSTAAKIGKIKKRVAIIGAGSGGSSAAYFLRKNTCPDKYDLDLTIFEKNGYIGGRSTTVNVYGDPERSVELGASIFVRVNRNLVNAAEELGLELEELSISERVDLSPKNENGDDVKRDELGVWNGREFVFKSGPGSEDDSSRWWWWDIAKLIWRYGLAPIKTNRLMKSTVGNFLKMYDRPIFPFKDLTEAAKTVGLLDATGTTGAQFLVKNGVGISKGSFATELVQASTRVNYGQNLGVISGMETMVCMAAEGAIAVKGGNWKIFAGMAEAAKATILLETLVTNITKHEDGKWTLRRRSLSPESSSAGLEIEEPAPYDAVVLATPYIPRLDYSDITIHPPNLISPSSLPYTKTNYVSLHVTLFTSPYRLSPKFFGLMENEKVPLVVLTTLTPEEQEEEAISGGDGRKGVGKVGFWSISTLREETNPKTGQIEFLYKIFSPISNPLLEDDQVLQYLDVAPTEKKAITWIYRKKWYSYPFLFPRREFDKIVLDESAESGKGGSLYYTSSIEPFISTMETSSLMGMNVAGLIAKSWEEERRAENEEIEEKVKEELRKRGENGEYKERAKL